MKNAQKTAAKKPAARKAAGAPAADRADDQLGKTAPTADAGGAGADGDGGGKAAAKSSEGVTATAGNATTEAPADASVDPSNAGVGAPAADAPLASSPAGTNSTDNLRAKTDGGAGNPAGPAALSELTQADIEALAARDPAGFADLEKRVDAIETDFRTRFPRFSAAVDAWMASGREDQPSGLRIASKHEGFRRAGMPHSKRPTDHPIEKFSGPEQLEALLAEPNLTVELI